jgi:hypothetical protein
MFMPSVVVGVAVLGGLVPQVRTDSGEAAVVAVDTHISNSKQTYSRQLWLSWSEQAEQGVLEPMETVTRERLAQHLVLARGFKQGAVPGVWGLQLPTRQEAQAAGG